jgi:hypothetical protein
MRWRNTLDALAILFAVGIGLLALAFLDTSYIVILAPLSLIGGLLLIAGLAVNRRWWLLLFVPFLAIPFVPWSTL